MSIPPLHPSSSNLFSYPTEHSDLSIEKAFEKGSKLLGSENEKASGIALLCHAAENGHIGACTKVASCYLNGIGCTEDFTKAFMYLRIAEEANDAEGLLMLAECYINGKGISQNAPLGMAYLERAATLGNQKAMFTLALQYDMGTIVPKNIPAAKALIQQSAALGFGPAQFYVAMFILQGYMEGSIKDVQLWMEKASENGVIEATYHLGLSKFSQESPYYDVQKGLSLFKKAATYGHIESLGMLSMANISGQSIPMDIKVAIRNLQLISTLGCHKWDHVLNEFRAR